MKEYWGVEVNQLYQMFMISKSKTGGSIRFNNMMSQVSVLRAVFD